MATWGICITEYLIKHCYKKEGKLLEIILGAVIKTAFDYLVTVTVFMSAVVQLQTL